tara:strand:+ start:323 stop:598 length:276 start_codon:yes stop_codon:yes gene_type:complete
MKTLYQILCFPSETDVYSHSYSRVYESEQQAEKILAIKRDLAPDQHFELREVKLVIEFKSEQVKKHILMDNAIKIDDAEADDIRNSAFLRS